MSMEWLSFLPVGNLETSLPPKTVDTCDGGVPSLFVRKNVSSLVTPPGVFECEVLQPEGECLIITKRQRRWEPLCGS
jgi:hypothetical protein